MQVGRTQVYEEGVLAEECMRGKGKWERREARRGAGFKIQKKVGEVYI